jgi:hypothetical protein
MRTPLLFALLCLPAPALAMNWEGHDDWMADHPAAVALERAAGQAQPLPPTPCNEHPIASSNPYEQVPLAADACREAEPLPTPDR